MVERGGLENRCGCKPTQGSNPCLSATILRRGIRVCRSRPRRPSSSWTHIPYRLFLVRSPDIRRRRVSLPVRARRMPCPLARLSARRSAKPTPDGTSGHALQRRSGPAGDPLPVFGASCPNLGHRPQSLRRKLGNRCFARAAPAFFMAHRGTVSKNRTDHETVNRSPPSPSLPPSPAMLRCPCSRVPAARFGYPRKRGQAAAGSTGCASRDRSNACSRAVTGQRSTRCW